MNNPIITMLMNQLQGKNPHGYQMINNMMTNGGNPEAFLKQIVSKASPEQMESLLKQAKNFGVPDNVLSQIQNMK